MLQGKYTDQMKVYGNTVWFDLTLKKWITDISKQSESWLDFITGCNQNGYSIIANCNGTYSLAGKVDIISKSLMNSFGARKLLGDISRQSFWQLKVRKNFPDPAYSQDGIELWEEEKIQEYIKDRQSR